MTLLPNFPPDAPNQAMIVAARIQAALKPEKSPGGFVHDTGRSSPSRETAIAALGLVVVLYGFARLTAPSRQENAALASRFRFERSPMPAISGFPYKYIRAVQPSLKRIDAWISAVGAGAALADLDGDGLPNDLCHSEPRTDQVIVSPVPGTGDRYAPFTLDAPPGSYKPGTVAPMGCVFADLNEDGRMDILVYYWGRTPVLFLRRTGEPGVPARLSAADFEAVPIGTAGNAGSPMRRSQPISMETATWIC